jgi:LysR family transcriptional regulator, glycine cleavage system transcriptional activator
MLKTSLDPTQPAPASKTVIPHRPLDVGQLRAFTAVAKHLNFRAAAEELYLTQSAVSRQIQTLEAELGAQLFMRHTRVVELTIAGTIFLHATRAALERIDAAVRQIRLSRGRLAVGVNTFASFASMWLIPRLHLFQQQHPGIDIRISTADHCVDDDAPDVDLILRYSPASEPPPNGVLMFDDCLTLVASPRLGGQPLLQPAHLASHTLINDEDFRPSAEWRSWARWFAAQNVAPVEPQRWLTFNYAYQHTQAAIAGQGVALARLPLVADMLASGVLTEVMPSRRLPSTPYRYWLGTTPHARARPEVQAFSNWVQQQAALTRKLINGAPELDGITEAD